MGDNYKLTCEKIGRKADLRYVERVKMKLWELEFKGKKVYLAICYKSDELLEIEYLRIFLPISDKFLKEYIPEEE